MDIFATLIALVALIIGLAVGLLLGVRSGRASVAASLEGERGRALAAEATAAALREQLVAARADDRELAERERRDAAVLQALAPVRSALDQMREHVAQLETERTEQYGQIAAQLRVARESDEQLRRTTESLAGALRSNATRGVWGEAALRRVVEAAGLTRHVDFATQASITGEGGAGRPDMVVRLPGEAAIPVDAKVPLDAYLEASAIPITATGTDEERRRELMKRHVRAVRAHVDALSKKAYWTGIDGAPEFVICFLPNEALLAAALDEDPTLLDHAFSRRVALASPVNLWAVLKTVSYAWTQQDVSEQARQLFTLGTTLYERLAQLAGHADKLRRAIERTVETYNGFVGSLESRVLVTARAFPGIDESKIIPAADPISAQPRTFTASELIASSVTDDSAATTVADIGDLRERIGDADAAEPAPASGSAEGAYRGEV